MLSHSHQLLRLNEPLSRRTQIVLRRPLATLAVICSAVLVATIGYAVSARLPTAPQSEQAGGPSLCNPPGILPPDLDAEIAQVRAEMRTILGRYLAQANALTPLTVSNTQGVSNPPTIQGSGYEAVRILSALLNYDENMSPLRNVACASCTCRTPALAARSRPSI
jgi:hypothetical protein